ncbi:MAG: beta galactosidase jelly roll domain-containing protein, partial [Elusimicrobiales bacterium]|nr:beta galactosidase jelly roll domain-containing protein [Elusimicrobiales bacterium]
EAAEKLETARERFVRGINSGLWNETAGRYDNLSLWGKRDERSSSGENALAVLEGVAPAERIPRILRAVKESNWREAGSATIFPPMTHVGLDVDHNFKVWPWWNAVEAKARFLNGDIEGGVHLLRSCSKTLEDPHYPGMMEELLSPDGAKTEGGNAFLTAAGSYQDAVFGGLLGIEILEAGRARIRVSPNTPAAWKDWSASVPLPGGEIILEQKKGKLVIRVSDPAVKTVEAPEKAKVEGAVRAPLSRRSLPDPAGLTAPEIAAVPAPRRRASAVFYDKNIPAGPLEGLPARRVTADGLLGLAGTDIDALIIAGNALPARTAAGADTRPALAAFLDRGGALVFYGAEMDDRGRVGETGGVIDWYEQRPSVAYSAVSGWLFRASTEGPGTPREKDRGLAEGWFKPGLSETGWEKTEVPAPWEKHFGRDYDGWGWYRAHFRLPAGARGKALTFSIGRADDMDWTFVNGILIGSDKDWIKFRRYTLKPGDSAYASLNFGGDNVLAVQVWDGGGGGGLYADPVELGVDTGRRSWQAVSQTDGMTFAPPVRHGVVSWGPGNFFNSWETSRGAFGFRIEGRGVEFAGPLAGLPPLDVPVREAFTDFAVSRPWRFQPLAYTETRRNLLVPDNGERYPCAARVLNTETGGEFVLIPASAAGTPSGPELLKKLLLY